MIRWVAWYFLDWYHDYHDYHDITHSHTILTMFERSKDGNYIHAAVTELRENPQRRNWWTFQQPLEVCVLEKHRYRTFGNTTRVNIVCIYCKSSTWLYTFTFVHARMHIAWINTYLHCNNHTFFILPLFSIYTQVIMYMSLRGGHSAKVSLGTLVRGFLVWIHARLL